MHMIIREPTEEEAENGEYGWRVLRMARKWKNIVIQIAFGGIFRPYQEHRLVQALPDYADTLDDVGPGSARLSSESSGCW